MRKLAVAAVVIAVVAALAPSLVKLVRMGPRDYFGMLLYDQRREGDLEVGDAAPDFALTSLDGSAAIRLAERVGERPLVLVFGSFT